VTHIIMGCRRKKALLTCFCSRYVSVCQGIFEAIQRHTTIQVDNMSCEGEIVTSTPLRLRGDSIMVAAKVS
jgi:hypothetical protein